MGTYAVKSRQSEPAYTNYSEVNSQHNSNFPQTSVTKGELRASENKIYNMFEEKFVKIEKMVRKSLRKSSKSKNSSRCIDTSTKTSPSNILIKDQTFAME